MLSIKTVVLVSQNSDVYLVNGFEKKNNESLIILHTVAQSFAAILLSKYTKAAYVFISKINAVCTRT